MATPALGIFLAFVGVMLLWPPAVLLAFLSALGFLFVLVLATRERLSQRLFPAVGQGVVEPAEEEPSPARRKAS